MITLEINTSDLYIFKPNTKNIHCEIIGCQTLRLEDYYIDLDYINIIHIDKKDMHRINLSNKLYNSYIWNKDIYMKKIVRNLRFVTINSLTTTLDVNILNIEEIKFEIYSLSLTKLMVHYYKRMNNL